MPSIGGRLGRICYDHDSTASRDLLGLLARARFATAGKLPQKLTYANYAGALATAGNLIFLGHIDGTFSAYDAKTLNELWSFNVGTGINAPPITYAVNGKQYVAVLVGSRQPNNIIPQAPELKNMSTASMLYVFGL